MRTYYLEPTVYNKLYSVMQYSNALALRVSLETGLRIDDVLSLRVSQLNKRTLVGVAEKTGKSYRKVLSADLTNRLQQIKGETYFFEGRLDPKKHRTRQAVWKDVKKAAKILHINGNIAPHSARKTYAVTAFRDGGLKKAQTELGHSDVQTTMLYAFADYLDGLPNELTRSLTAKKKKGEAAQKKENTAADVTAGVKLDGHFWEMFSDLVAQKTAKRLYELIKPKKKTA